MSNRVKCQDHPPNLLIDFRTAPALLQEIVRDLQPSSRPVPLDLLDDLYTRHRGNLRACLRDLYDLYAREA